MESKLHENCVITGPVDSFCLLCEIYLTKKEITLHITASAHKDQLESSAYLDKFQDDRIRKVKPGYYCETCNSLILTLTKVGIHVKSTTHITNKNYFLLKEVDDGVIAFDDILIGKQAWNGLNNNSCFICNTDYSNENDHKNELSHILNTIQAKLELKRDEFVFRKSDDSFLNCLICNSLISVESKESHLEETEHMNNYSKCQENKKKLKVQAEHIETTKPKEPIKTETNEENVDTKNKDLDEDLAKSPENCVEVIKNCSTEHENTDQDENDILTPQEALKKTLQFAKRNGLKYKRNNTYCKLCDVKISSSLKRLKEHVVEQSHVEKANSFKEPVIKVPSTDFIRRETTLSSFFSPNEVIINDKFCITDLSYQMISDHGLRLRCQTCEVSIDRHERANHQESWKHIQGMQLTPVLTKFSNEFLREVRPGLYHCGFCNLIESSLKGLHNHLESISHGNRKTFAQRRLNEHLPDIMREREKRSFFNLIRMFSNL